MGNPDQLACAKCGAEFSLTKEYLAAFGGADVVCNCGAELPIPSSEDGPWSQGDFVVMRRWARWPYRCSLCNGPAQGGVLVEHVKSRPEAEIDMPGRGGRILNAAVASAMAETVIIHYARCASHRPRIIPRWVSWGCYGAAAMVLIAICVVSASRLTQNAFVFASGLLTMLALFIFGAVIVPWTHRHHELVGLHGNYAVIKGGGDLFLQSLPPFASRVEADAVAAADALHAMDESENLSPEQ